MLKIDLANSFRWRQRDVTCRIPSSRYLLCTGRSLLKAHVKRSVTEELMKETCVVVKLKSL